MKPRPPCASHSRHRLYGIAMACAAAGCWIAFRDPAPAHSTSGDFADERVVRRERGERASGEILEPEFRKAMEQADRMTNPDERDAARMNALIAWSERDAGAAFLHAFGRRPTPSLLYQRDLLFQRWAAEDFEGAEDFTDRLPAGDARDVLLGLLAMDALRIDPGQAAAIAMGEMSPGESQTEAVMSIVHQWAIKDHAAAQTWVAGFPEGELRERAAREIAGSNQQATPLR